MEKKERSKSIAEKLPGGSLAGTKKPSRQIDGWVGLGLALALIFGLLIMAA